MTPKHILYIAGALCEFLGVVAIAAPDLVPGLSRFARWTLRLERRASNAIRLRLGLEARQEIHNAVLELHAHATGSASGVVSTGATSLDARVEFLVRRDQETQHRLNGVEGRLRALEENLRSELERVRVETSAHVDDKIRVAQLVDRSSRLIGAGALVIGLGLSTWGNFLP